MFISFFCLGIKCSIELKQSTMDSHMWEPCIQVDSRLISTCQVLTLSFSENPNSQLPFCKYFFSLVLGEKNLISTFCLSLRMLLSFSQT
jgi:hypothetical protein